MKDKTIFQLRYLVMPDYIYSDSRLTDISRRVYCFIHTYKNPFYFTNDQLAEMFGCHKDTISGAVKQLEDLSLITTEYKTKANGGKTRLCLDTFSEKASTPTRVAKKRNPSRPLRLQKVISKGNFLKGEKIEETSMETPDSTNKLNSLFNRKKDRHQAKGKSLGFKSSYQKDPPKNLSTEPLDYLQLWQIAWDMQIPLPLVIEKHKAVMLWAEEGKLRDGVIFTIKNWLSRDIGDGKISRFDELESGWMDVEELKSKHPDEMEKTRKWLEEQEKKGIL